VYLFHGQGYLMASVEILARLTASAINPAACGGRSTNTESLSSAEIAGLLRGLTQEQMMLAQAKYMGDVAAQVKFLVYARSQATREAERGRWKVRPSQIQQIADIAAHESTVRRETVEVMAKSMGISKSTFQECWKKKLEALVMPLLELDAAVSRAIHKNSY
jgi:hypothetical protein